MSDNPYLDGLKQRYNKALSDEKKQTRAIESAREALTEAKARRARYALALRDEGVDVEVETAKPKTRTIYISTDESPSPNGHVKPLSETHAVFLLMRKHGNVGFDSKELAGYAKDEGYDDLTEERIRLVLWKQMGRGLIEKMDDGRFRQTETGVDFNGFRKQKAVA